MPTLTASGSNGTGTIVYTWTSPTSVVTNGATVAANESGTWTWTATDDVCSVSGTYDVIIYAEPTVTINAIDACAGDTQTISANGVPGSATYSWDFGSGATPATSTASTASVSYATGGTKTITLDIVTNGCTFQYQTTIEISNLTASATCN